MDKNFRISFTEKTFLAPRNRGFIYENEYLPVIETDNCQELGKLTAIRFLEWILEHQRGVISLRTGRTPKVFIDALREYKDNWDNREIQAELKGYRVNSKKFPDTTSLKFVQMDEFLGVSPDQENSFQYFIKKHYSSLLEIKPENLLMMDIASFTSGFQSLEEVGKFCKEYEEKIQAWEGIGFFLGGIGPDGHIAFNMSGSSFESETRLVSLNYESAAVAAKVFGGIEFVRNKKAVTIGLKTIAAKKDATIIIFASGKSKATVVSRAIEEKKNERNPASVLQGHDGARFYITKPAASLLYSRRVEDIRELGSLKKFPEVMDEIVYETAIIKKKAIKDLNENDFKASKKGSLLLLAVDTKIENILDDTSTRLACKIKKGLKLPRGLKILHTAPHPDDVMLAYHPYVVRLMEENENYFAYFTNGFRGVSNSYLTGLLREIDFKFVKQNRENVLGLSYPQILKKFKESFEWEDLVSMKALEAIILLRAIVSVFGVADVESLGLKIETLQKVFQNDSFEIQKLKGKLRESEVDRMWHIHGISQENVFHLRSKFYFPGSSLKDEADDVENFLELINKIKPDVITVAADPKDVGPDTHYKALQLVARALQAKKGNNFEPKVWGYRNVWHSFKLEEVDVVIPVSCEELDMQDRIFKKCFMTQRDAPFPLPLYEGPFSEFSCKVQREQFSIVERLLGDNFLKSRLSEKLRKPEGAVFLRPMSLEEFLEFTETLEE